MKPEYIIDITNNTKTPLEALPLLATLDANFGYHTDKGGRPPLGIYNTSLSRIFNKLVKCCNKMEEYFKLSNTIDGLSTGEELKDELLDCIELVLYSAAEHVDDIGLIAGGFFEDSRQYKKSKSVRKLNTEIKNYKSFISAITNSIKHQQSRIRMSSVEIIHDSNPLCLHGYFVEGVHSGVVGPNEIFHGRDTNIFSITALMWEIMVFVLNSSKSLSKFLSEICNIDLIEYKGENKLLNKAAIAAARLPLYSFDDTHPFANTKVIITTSDRSVLNSGLYGSIINGWTPSNDLIFVKGVFSYAGDGATKTFKIVKPMSIKLQYWG